MITWTGGGYDSDLDIEIFITPPGQPVFHATGYLGSADVGSLLVEQQPFSTGAWVLPPWPTGNVEIIVTQTPHAFPSTSITPASAGLAGGEGWRYVYDFKGLTN